MQLVGYGTQDGQDYWLVRNSWTVLWGDAGYIKLARSATPTCGTDTSPLDGNVRSRLSQRHLNKVVQHQLNELVAQGCKGGPPTVRVCGESGVLFDGVYPVL